ncbi:endonuclease/exonuclease/phosphatase family protein [Seohaeicola saemankumensis]|uniref:Endonuclease/exonuclease/phosphatase family protein n=1 Tax=Seohaeicola saemankumensis TaxID=481181 RepID=A0ABW3TDJ9_9RHOB
MRDILGGKDPQVQAVVAVIAHAAPDILLLLDVDHDHDLVALRALRDAVEQAGVLYPHVYARASNRGMTTGLDLDGDGRQGGAGDTQGYAEFAGQGGMAILSRHPVGIDRVQDHSALLWRDLPDALLTLPDGQPLLTAQALAVQRLSTTGHWTVPITVRGRDIHLLAFHATPPVFDGPEDRNGRRNHDETRFWSLYLDGRFAPPPTERFVLIGDGNMDPAGSEGLPDAMRAILGDPRLQDPKPTSVGGLRANATGPGDPALHTASWPPPGPSGLRVDLVLPSADLKVLSASVLWPEPGAPLADTVQTASRHRLVSVTLDWP